MIMSTIFLNWNFSQAAQGVERRLLDPGWRGQSHSGWHAELLRQESGMVEASLYATQCIMVEPGGHPDPCLQTLLPETGVMEESGGIRDPCSGFLARIQPFAMPTPLNGHGRIRRCVDGSLNMP